MKRILFVLGLMFLFSYDYASPGDGLGTNRDNTKLSKSSATYTYANATNLTSTAAYLSLVAVSTGNLVTLSSANASYIPIINSGANFGGNVGIGSGYPDNKLSVIGNVGISGLIFSSNTVNIYDRNPSSTSPSLMLMSEAWVPGQQDNRFISMRNYTSGDTGWDIASLAGITGDLEIQRNLFGLSSNVIHFNRADGNIGIGMGTPTNKFEVVGNVGISGVTYASGTVITPRVDITSQPFVKLNGFDRGKTTTLTLQDSYYSLVGTVTLATDSAWFNVFGTTLTYVGPTKKFTVSGMVCGSLNAANETVGLALFYNNVKEEYAGYTRNSNQANGAIYQQTVYMEKTLTSGDTLDLRIANETAAGKIYTQFVWTLVCISIN